MTRLLLAAVLAGGLATALPAAAQFQKPEDAVKYRQSAMTLIAHHFGGLAAMAQGKVPYDAKAAAFNANIVATLAHLPFTAFGEGTDMDLHTKAKAEIWKDPAKFKAAQDKLFAAVTKLDVAAKAGTLDALKPAVGATGEACKGCHDDFRSK